VYKNKTLIKTAVFIALVLISTAISGCVRTGSTQAGWSGVVPSNGGLYLGSSNGKLVALNAENGFYQWQQDLEGVATTGGLGCAGAAVSVVYATPVISDNTIYIGDYSGRLYAFSINDRQSKSVLLNGASSKAIIGSPLVNDGSIYVGSTDGVLYVFDAASLTPKWSYNTGGEIWASPARWQDSVFVASFDTRLYSLDVNSGEPNWQEPFECNGPIIAGPVIYNDYVIVTSLDRHVYALDASTGELIWEFPGHETTDKKPGKWLWASPVVLGDKIFVAGMDGNIFVINADNGSLVQVIDVEKPVSSTPVIAGNSLVVATETGKVYAINIETYQKIELRDLDTTVSAPLGVSGINVFVHSIKSNTVYALSGETGALLWSTSIN
jgi:outer membrane protein assembly factor BamB